jgi:hypothetical protein
MSIHKPVWIGKTYDLALVFAKKVGVVGCLPNQKYGYDEIDVSSVTFTYSRAHSTVDDDR